MSKKKDVIDQKPPDQEQEPAIEEELTDEPAVEEELTDEAPESYELVLPIVLRQPRTFDGHDFVPGHQIAEIRIMERGVSLNFLVDAIKDKIASEIIE